MTLSLRARLRLGLAVIAATLVLLSLAAIASLERLGGAIETILRENYRSVVACDHMKEALERQDSATLLATTGRDDVARPMLERYRPAFQKAFDVEAANITLPGEGELVEAVKRDYRAYVDATDGMLSQPIAARGDVYFQQLLPRFVALKTALLRIQQMNQSNMEQGDDSAKKLARRTVNVAIAVSIAVALFAIWFAWWLPRAMVGPVDALSRTARAIGEGALDVQVPQTETEELAPLADAFRRMLDQLRAYRASSLGELLAAKDLANSTIACMLDPVVVFGAQGEVLLANDAAERAFGLQPGTKEELAALDVSVPEAIAAARDTVLSRRESVLPQSLAEAMRTGEGRDERYFLVRAAPLEGSLGAVVLAQDVTRYRRIDELKSDVVATVSHQFKTPLTSLRMATHLLLEPSMGPLTDGQRELVQTSKDETERLRAMVDELLDLVRIESEAGALHRTHFDPTALLAEVADAHRTVAKEKGVALEVKESEPFVIDADPERLSIVLANLVSNAVRHTPAGGRVTLAAARENGAAKLSVRDTGDGIASSDLARIFDRSVTLGDGEDRHGLGLAIAREIVLHHGGDLTVESEPGEGSLFTVTLPLAS